MILARADADDTIAYLDVVTDRDSDVSYEDVYVDMHGENRIKGIYPFHKRLLFTAPDLKQSSACGYR